MSVPAIVFHASPPGGVCSTSHHPCSAASSHGSVDFDHLNSRASTSASAHPSFTIQKPIAIVGGLSRLFSSSSSPSAPVRPASAASSFTGGDGLGLLLQQHDRSDDLGCSHSYSSIQAAVKCGARDHGSPVSVFQGPVSCGAAGAGAGAISVGSSRSSGSPLSRITREVGDFRTGRDRLFSRFLTHAVGSCLDYQSQSSAVSVGVGLDLDELPFHLEDGFAGAGLDLAERQPYAESILSAAQKRHSIFHDEFVIRAFYEAEKAHRGQMRASGDPYLQHCVDTAILLADIGANTTVVAAGLLHDTLDDSFMTHSYICRTFGNGVADLVEGVSKLSQLSKLARENNTASRMAEAEGLHTMFLAMADARAVLIKIADRLHNMMTLDALPMVKQQRFAKETLEIFAPLANRLGISTWKEQLENLCFKHLNPEEHRELSSKLVRSFDEAMVGAAKDKLGQSLNEEGISYHVLSGRYKSLYSIHSKMLRKKLAMDEIHDIHGLRLIVETEDDCYKALEVVHKTWPRVLGRYKDYILRPKFNGYQSLHTVVSSEDGFPLEVQIRTKEMHLQAEFGFAAHWRYKEGDSKYSSFVLQMVEWARWVVSWQCETMSKEVPYSVGKDDSIRPPCPFPSHSKECPFSYTPKGDNDGPVFVILLENEKMSVQEFPANSTMMDLFDRVAHGCSRWTSYSFPSKEELRPKLNHLPVADPKLKLKMGDVVELTPSIPDKSLTEYREEIRRMYTRDLAASIKVGRRR